tara:strand:+ start:1357 stop:1974 length:618 start_codon:yes stop_codon:yes gene_type:complete
MKKKIILILLISLSAISYAIDKTEGELSRSMSPIVVQKALDSGVVFTTNQYNYQLILGGRAFTNTINSRGDQAQAQTASFSSSNSNLWSSQSGPYQFSVSSVETSVNSSLSSNGVSYKQIAYNPETGNIGIIVGDIIVKLLPYYDAEAIAGIFNIELAYNFENINTVIFQVNSRQDIFAIAERLSEHPGVEFAEVDVIENFPMLN